MNFWNTSSWLLLICATLSGCGDKIPAASQEPASRPNIVYILADDLGYGDVSCYNSAGKIKTPNIDRLASQGMRFTDAHAPSSVCTPTRFALLTGNYAWRSRLPVGVLRGYGRALIPSNSFTVSSYLKNAGYHTGVVGKWHLGLDWKLIEGHEGALKQGSYGVRENGMVSDMKPEHIDFDTPPSGGPIDLGFDYSFILPASLDMDPYCYLENDTLVESPTGYTPGNDLETGYTGAFWRPGKMAPSFEFDQVLNTITEKSISYVEDRARSGQPFFLYLPFAAPHTPWVPTDDYAGKSGAGTYGDFVSMVDDAVGRVLSALDSLGLEENTLVIFASDNGPFWRPAFIERFGHRAAGQWRGMKADIYEGGHRVPLIMRWPGKVRAGVVSEAPTTLANLAATCSGLLGIPLQDSVARDSYSILPVLMQQSDTVPGQQAIIHHSSMGHFAIRQGQWKLIEQLGSGGFTEPSKQQPAEGEPAGQLYNLAEDPGETNNLFAAHPGKVKALHELLRSLQAEHR